MNDRLDTDRCTLCEEVVARGDFAFVDYEVKRRGGSYLEEPGYYRVSLSTLGDPRCDHHLRAKERTPYGLRVPADFGQPDSQCFAIERLETRPQGYVFGQAFRRTPAPNGYVVGVVEQFIRHESSGEVVAVNRDYLYTSVVRRIASGGGVTDATCPTAYAWRFDPLAMLKGVLADDETP